jgi:hypothetical protein
MPTTSNFGWTTPADTDLVKDGAAAIRTLGNGVDSSFVDLKGGTTGQVLAKASNTDLDFSWVAQDDSNAIQNALLTTTGDTIYASSASTPARLGIGSTGQVLTVSGGIPAWATPTGAADNYTLINTGGTALTGATTITVSGISGKNSLIVVITGASSASASAFEMRFNSDSTFKYDFVTTKTISGPVPELDRGFGANNSIDWATIASATGTVALVGKIDGANASGLKFFNFTSYSSSLGNGRVANYTYSGTSAISSISVISGTGNFDAGTIYVYGA